MRNYSSAGNRLKVNVFTEQKSTGKKTTFSVNLTSTLNITTLILNAINGGKIKAFAHYSSATIKINAVLKYSQKGKVNLLADRIYFSENNEFEKSSNYLIKI